MRSRLLIIVVAVLGFGSAVPSSAADPSLFFGFAEDAPKWYGAEAAVFAIPHPRWIEAVTAAIVPRAGQTVAPEDVIPHCRGQLAGFKTPKYVVIADELPKNPSGKILKRELRETYAGLASDG